MAKRSKLAMDGWWGKKGASWEWTTFVDETDRRFHKETGYKGQLDPRNPDDAPYIKIWNEIYRYVKRQHSDPSPTQVSGESQLTTRQKLDNLNAFIWKHEDLWTSMGMRATRSSPLGQALSQVFRYLDRWLPTYQERYSLATYIKDPIDPDIEEILIDPSTKRLSETRALATSLGLPVPPLAPRSKTSISGVAMMPRSFLACCRACLTDEGELLVSCELPDGRYFERTVQLRPIAERIKQMIRHYHANVLHGDMQEETVSGIGDWYHASVSAAARIANSKAVNHMWEEVQKHHGEIELGLSLVPGGQGAAAALRTGMAVHAMVSKAKNGDPVAAQDVAAIVALSEKGDAKAEQVTAMMRSMNHMINTKEAKAGVVVGRRHHRKHHRRAREEQDYEPRESSPGSQSDPDSGDYYGDNPREERTSGWLFNRPYRLLAITPGLALRGLYNLGLAT